SGRAGDRRGVARAGRRVRLAGLARWPRALRGRLRRLRRGPLQPRGPGGALAGDAVGPSVDLFGGYVVPLYSRVGRVSPWQAIVWHAYGRPLIALLGLLVVLALLGPTSREPARKGLALMGVLYGIVHFVVQGKGWEYQLYPLIVFCCALVPAAVVSWRRFGWARALDLFGARRPLALAAWTLLVVVLSVKGVEASDAGWIAEKARRVADITRDLEALAPPGATVQVMDTTSGGVHSVVRLHP